MIIMHSFSDKILNSLTGLFFLALFAPFFFWDKLEGAKIPTHFNMSGQADGWGGRCFFVFLIGIALAPGLFLILCYKYPEMINYPRKISKEDKPKLYLIGKKMILRLLPIIMALFAFISINSLLMALGEVDHLFNWIMHLLLGCLVLCVVVFIVETNRI